jgi:anti-anti-sigma factor
MEDSTGHGSHRDANGDHVADLADQSLVRANVDRQAGTRVEPIPGSLNVRRVDHRLVVVLTLRGELDLATVPLLEQQVDRVPRGRGVVVIDLSGLRFIDSSGLQVLVRAERQLRASGGQLVLVHGPRAVRRAFELTSLDRHFAWCDSPSVALRTAREPKTASAAIPEAADHRPTTVQVDPKLGGATWS